MLTLSEGANSSVCFQQSRASCGRAKGARRAARIGKPPPARMVEHAPVGIPFDSIEGRSWPSNAPWCEWGLCLCGGGPPVERPAMWTFD